MQTMRRCGKGDEMQNLSDKFLGSRLADLYKLRNRGTKDQLEISEKLFSEYSAETLRRGLKVETLIESENKNEQKRFAASIFRKKL